MSSTQSGDPEDRQSVEGSQAGGSYIASVGRQAVVPAASLPPPCP